jgi:hypothetical protein
MSVIFGEAAIALKVMKHWWSSLPTNANKSHRNVNTNTLTMKKLPEVIFTLHLPLPQSGE